MYDLNSVIMQHDALLSDLGLLVGDYLSAASEDEQAVITGEMDDLKEDMEQLENITEMLRAARS